MAKILGIMGSHRQGGATEFYLNEALKAAREEGVEVEMVSLHDKDIKFCRVCYECRPENKGCCTLKDDALEILRRMEEADGILIATPVYFGLPSSRLKALMDRTISLRVAGFKLRNKVGGALAVGAHRHGGQEIALTAIHAWMLVHDMLVVSDGMPTAHFGAAGFARGRADAEKDEIGVKLARNLGKRLAQAVKLLEKAGKQE
ncbi:flavodoxin family protein [Candidatus Bathyarchaeota archaeon]|nr:MAG: flavodoxin family protein [Candidatus Hecatellales archaeon]RLI35196.1 MAG: flavodoxin family protein [Candidatus Bathyarchaeota archaeon]